MSDDMLPPVVAALQANIDDFKSKMGDAKGEMGAVENEGKSKFAGLATAVGAGLLAVGAAAVAIGAKSIKTFNDTASSIDDLQDITGESAEKMSKLQYAFTSWGMSSDETEKALLKLSKQVGKNNEVFEKYHIATTDAAGKTLPMSQIVANAADVFARMPDGIEKTNLATKLFGASGKDLLDVMNQGSAGLSALGEEAEKYGLVIGQDAVDGQQKNAASQRQMSAAWKGIQIQIGEHLMPILSKLTGFLAEHLPAAVEFVKKAIAAVQPYIERVGEALKAAFGWLMDHKEILIGVAVGVGAALVALFVSWAAGAAAAAAATLAAAAPFIAIGAVIASVVAGVILAYNHWQTFHDVVDAVGRFLRDTLWPALQDVFGWLRDNVPPIIQGVITAATWLWNNVLSPLVSFLKGAWSVQVAIWKVQFEVVKTAIDILITAATWLWQNVLSPLVDFLKGAWSVQVAIWKVQFEVVKTAIDILVTAATWLWQNVLSPFVSFLQGAWSLVWAAIKIEIDIVKGAIDLLVTSTTWLWRNILEPFVSFIGAGFTLAWSGAKVIFDGIKTAVDAISTAAGWLWHNVLSPIVDFLKGAFDTGWKAAQTALGYVIKPIQTIVDWIQKIIDKAGAAWQALKDLNPFQETVSGTLNLPGTTTKSGSSKPGLVAGGAAGFAASDGGRSTVVQNIAYHGITDFHQLARETGREAAWALKVA